MGIDYVGEVLQQGSLAIVSYQYRNFGEEGLGRVARYYESPGGRRYCDAQKAALTRVLEDIATYIEQEYVRRYSGAGLKRGM